VPEKEKTMKEKVLRMGPIMSMVLSLALVLAACSTAPMTKSDIEEKRDSVRAMASKTLADLEKKNPEARTAISDAAGYAVFSDVGLKIIYMGTAKGGGIAVNNKTKQETFMKMFELQPGLGLGAEKYRVVFVFETPEAFNSFVTSGREIGADAMAAAKNKTKGCRRRDVVEGRIHVSGRYGGRNRGCKPDGRKILQGQGAELTSGRPGSVYFTQRREI